MESVSGICGECRFKVSRAEEGVLKIWGGGIQTCGNWHSLGFVL